MGDMVNSSVMGVEVRLTAMTLFLRKLGFSVEAKKGEVIITGDAMSESLEWSSILQRLKEEFDMTFHLKTVPAKKID